MSKTKAEPKINKAKPSNQYKEGILAYEKEVPRNSNPYQNMTYKFTEWDRGWFHLWYHNVGIKGGGL